MNRIWLTDLSRQQFFSLGSGGLLVAALVVLFYIFRDKLIAHQDQQEQDMEDQPTEPTNNNKDYDNTGEPSKCGSECTD